MKLQVIQHEIEEHQPPATYGLFAGLWLADVMFAVEYWCVRSVQLGLWSLGFAQRNYRALAVLSMVAAGTGFSAYATVRSSAATVKLVAYDEMTKIAHGAPVRTDPWGTTFRVVSGPGGSAVVSAGPDREFGTPDDLILKSSGGNRR